MNAPYSVVSARNLSLTFETNDGPVHALSNVDLEVKKGDFVSFIGPSGCGKTTFLRVIADLTSATRGKAAAHNGVMRLDQLQRGVVANFLIKRGRADDVGEKDCREDALCFLYDDLAVACDEFLDVAAERHNVPFGPRSMISGRIFNIARARDMSCKIATIGDRDG